MTTYKLSDIIKQGKREILVSDLIKIKGEIFRFIKMGYSFDDEVLNLVGIKKHIHDVETKHFFIEHEKESKQEYKKDTESLNKILSSLHSLDNNKEPFNEILNQEKEIKTCNNFETNVED